MISHNRLEEGQGLVEYALILVLVAVAVIAILVVFGEQLAAFYQYAIDQIGEVIS
jgi:Flp pilus assembly pilin Flp